MSELKAGYNHGKILYAILDGNAAYCMNFGLAADGEQLMNSYPNSSTSMSAQQEKLLSYCLYFGFNSNSASAPSNDQCNQFIATQAIFHAGDLVATLTTDKGGNAEVKNLYLSNYYVKEITPSEGYLLDEEEHDVICDYEGNLVAEVSRSTTSPKQIIKQPFQLIKVSDNGDDTEAPVLSGAGFTAYLKSSLSVLEDGSYDFDSAKPVEIGSKGETTLFTDVAIQNRIIANGKRGIATWLYIDEFHVLLNSEYSAKYLQQLWKKVRKQGGLCTGITQNIVDLLQNYMATTMLANSEFVALLKQANTDSSRMAEVIGVSEAQLRFVTNTSSGMGLMKCGNVVIPFDNTIEKGTDLYNLYNTNIHEKIQMQKMAEKGRKAVDNVADA